MAYKILKNETNFDMIVRLICRVGDEPNNKGERIDVALKAGATAKASYGKDGPFLNGLRIQSETNGHMTRKRQVVTVRGSAWDDTLNTNDTLTIRTTSNMNVRGSNS